MPKKYNPRVKISDVSSVPVMNIDPLVFTNSDGMWLGYNSTEESNDDFQSSYFQKRSGRKSKGQYKKGTRILQ